MNDPGRKLYFDAQKLMDVWLEVQEAMARHGVSAYAFCLRRELWWVRAGAYASCARRDKERGILIVQHSARTETLRRRYQQAVRFLKAENEPYERLYRMGARSTQFGRISPTELFWRQELERRLHRGQVTQKST